MSQDISEYRNLVAELKTAVDNNNQEQITKISEAMDKIEGVDDKFTQLERKMDDLEFRFQGDKKSPEEKKNEIKSEFITHFNRFNSGDRAELAKTEVKSEYHSGVKSANHVRFDFASAGALLMPDQISADIIRNAVEATPALQLARVTPVSSSNYKRNARTGTPGGKWLEETGESTKGVITYKSINITPHKWAASYGHSIEMSEDTAYDLVREVTDAYREDFSYDIGNAVLNGNGVGKPVGMLGKITNYDAGQLAIDPDDLIIMQEELKEAYQGNASWLFTRKTRAYIRTLVLSSDNALQYLWEPNFKAGMPTLLLGAPVYIAREGDLAGRVSGDFTAGQVYAVYGDFNQGYEVAMHTDMYMIDDPYSQSSQFIRNYHIMSRIGGNVIQPEALVQITAAGS